jgi:hypothetical protein
MSAIATLATPTDRPNPKSEALSPADLPINAFLPPAHRKDQHGTVFPPPTQPAFGITLNTRARKAYLRCANPTPPQVHVSASPLPVIQQRALHAAEPGAYRGVLSESRSMHSLPHKTIVQGSLDAYTEPGYIRYAYVSGRVPPPERTPACMEMPRGSDE